ncbi:MAG: hypothetical protein AAGK04_01220, partial [Planctomycetota bacterium]
RRHDLVAASYDPLQSRQPRVGPLHAVPKGRLRNNPWTASANPLSGYTFPLDGELGPAARRGQPIGSVPAATVRFPGQKVYMYDWYDRHSQSGERYYTLPGARQPMLFFDGSVQTHSIDDANEGWQPGRPEWALDTTTYFDGVKAPMRFRWTRGGLLGVDYGGSSLGFPTEQTR